MDGPSVPLLRTAIYEDNEGALKLAKTELPVKYHWFRQHMMSGNIKVAAVRTSDQLADLFTKGLCWENFASLRKKLIGW